jgi:hypothetical protein
MGYTSKYAIYEEQVRELVLNNPKYRKSNSLIAQKILGETNEYSTNHNSFRIYLNRNIKRILDEHDGVYQATNRIDVQNNAVRHLWMEIRDDEGKKRGNAFVKNPNFLQEEHRLIEYLRNELIADIQKFTPKFPKLEREKDKKSYLLVLDPADIHLGKLCSSFETGEEYNNQIAVKRVHDGIDGILNKVSSFNIDKILFIGGNDILHIDNAKSTTTSGTFQDSSDMWYNNFMIAKKLYIEVLLKLLSIADVHFTFNPSNHDYTNGFFLAQVIEVYFKDCKNITFDNSIAHRKGFRYYNNLIGTTHGDGAKINDLPLLMAQEYSQYWSETKHRYVYTHHVHHKTSKDYIGITIESLRSPSGTDSWHHRNGYQHSPKAVEGFLHCKQNGQIARITHLF